MPANIRYLLLFAAIPVAFSSCTKSNSQPPVSDSSYVINGLSIYLGGDSTNWNVSTRNTYQYDSLSNQMVQTITESSFGAPNNYTYTTTYQYDQNGRLQQIVYGRSDYAYKQMTFEYNSSGDIQRGHFIDFYGATIDNEFTVTAAGGNIIVTQYDTATANLGKGQYSSSRPAIVQYTLNAQGQLVSKYSIYSELYNDRPAFGDTTDTRYTYDGDHRLTGKTTHNAQTNKDGSVTYTDETMQFVKDGQGIPVLHHFAQAVLGNLDWLVTCDGINLFQNLSSIQYGSVSEEEPLQSTFDSFNDRNYTTTYQNTFDSLGLLQNSVMRIVEKNNVNAGNTMRESHYYTYLKVNK